MKIDEGNIIEDQNNENIEINIKGKIMQKSSNTISLKSIYDLVITMKNDVDIIKQDISNIKIDINQLKHDIKELKSLPTIAKELNQNNFL